VSFPDTENPVPPPDSGSSFDVVSALAEVSARFERNVGSVFELMNFDRVVTDFAVENVERLHQRLQQSSAADKPWLNAEHTLAALRNVRNNGSLRPHYQTIFNQCDVLIVSYFAAMIQDVFKVCLPERLRMTTDTKLLKQEMKLTLSDLKDNDFDLRDRFAELFIDARDISFQDMGSIARAFGEYVGYEPPRTPQVHNIIAGQACRHAIVHAGGIVDRRLIRQLASANSRQVQRDLVEGETIQFTPEEITIVATSMKAYVDDLAKGLIHQFEPRPGGLPTA
jgi:hypothetical protein